MFTSRNPILLVLTQPSFNASGFECRYKQRKTTMSHVNSSNSLAKNLPPNTEEPKTPPRNQSLERSNSMPRLVPKLNLNSLDAEGNSSSPSKIQTDLRLSPTAGEKTIDIGEPVLLQKTTVRVDSPRSPVRARSHRASSSPTKFNQPMTSHSDARESSTSVMKNLSPRKVVSSVSQQAISFAHSLKDIGSSSPDLKELFEGMEWTEFSSPGHDNSFQPQQPTLVKSPLSEKSLKRKSEDDAGSERKKIRPNATAPTNADNNPSSGLLSPKTTSSKSVQTPRGSSKSSLVFSPTELAKYMIESRQEEITWMGTASGTSIAGQLQKTLEKLWMANPKEITKDLYVLFRELFALLPAGAREDDKIFSCALKQTVVNVGLNEDQWRAIETLYKDFDKLELKPISESIFFDEFKSQLGKIIDTKNELLREKEEVKKDTADSGNV